MRTTLVLSCVSIEKFYLLQFLNLVARSYCVELVDISSELPNPNISCPSVHLLRWQLQSLVYSLNNPSMNDQHF